MMGIVGITILAFVAIVISSAALGREVELELTTIQTSYMPKLDLEPQLDAELEHIARGFQDAVATRDPDVLRETADSKARFVEELDRAGSAVDATAARNLRDALNEYYDAAYDVSRRMIADETGEGLVAAAASMQKKQAHVAEEIKATAAIDRRALADAFAESVRAETRARTYQLWIGITCFASIAILSFALSRNLIIAVSTLSDGLRRFGEGDFRHPIQYASQDELGDLATHANQMAASLERLDAARARAELALKASNRELEAFSYSVAHDLRAPLRGINGFSHALVEDHGDKLDADAKQYLDRIAGAAGRMGELIDALLAFSRLSRTEIQRKTIDLSKLAENVIEQLRTSHPDRKVEFVAEPGITAFGDPTLLRAVLENLLGNAWK
ncbi:MAG: sensor histidine kinase, partial [Polyangiaceae bacterium]